MKGLIDSTLREGAQAIGINYSKEQKEAILVAISKLGIEEIEVGIATPLDTDLPELFKICRQKLPNTMTSLWSRCVDTDIIYAAELNPDVLSLSIPASDLHIDKKFKKSRDWALKTLANSINFAHNSGISNISVGFEDATRANISFLKELVLCAQQAGAFRIRIADTVGIATPREISTIVNTIIETTHLEVGVHTHNDFGMATANAISALETGADWADVSTLGIGERAGCARLEEVAGFLALQKGRSYLIEDLPKLSQLVSNFTKKNIDKNQPIVGSEIFFCETGLHLLGLEEDPKTYEPYQPEHVGAKRHLVYGGKVGRKNTINRLTKLTKSIPKIDIDRFFHDVRNKALTLGRPLNDTEFLSASQSNYLPANR
nr:pyruvate carboxyltransferase [Desulfobulbaceae bacterium]